MFVVGAQSRLREVPREAMNQISRRHFVALAAAGVPMALSARSPAAAVTAQEIVDRVRKALAGDWRPETLDTFKAGDPSTVVTGIATTALPTLEVLGRAAAARANLIITSGPTFYARADTPALVTKGDAGQAAAPAAPDAVFAAKDDFIRKNNLVVWRFTEHWRARRPDPFSQGLIEALRWADHRTSQDPARVTIPEIPLDTLASGIRKALGARGGMRVVGRPGTRVRTIGVLPGSTPIQASLNMLPHVDVIVAGEVREWEAVEYVRDAVAAGGEKGLILVGRIVSEDPGMRVCAEWLTAVVPELTATWMPAGDLYWRPV